MVFDEKGEWDFETHENEYNFLSPLDEEKTPQHVQQELIPSTSTNHGDTLPSLESERALSHTRTVQDVFDQPERLDNITLFCLFIDCEPVDFEEAVQDKR